MKQLQLITKPSIKTPTNILRMRETYTNLFLMGFVDKALLDKVLTTQYERGL